MYSGNVKHFSLEGDMNRDWEVLKVTRNEWDIRGKEQKSIARMDYNEEEQVWQEVIDGKVRDPSAHQGKAVWKIVAVPATVASVV